MPACLKPYVPLYHIHMSACMYVCESARTTVSDAPKCMCNLRFRWWCRRVCKYVSGICYHGNRHSVSRCDGMAGAVLLARSSFHSDSTSQLPMQEFVCVCVLVCVCMNTVWILCECSLTHLTVYDLLCNVSFFFHLCYHILFIYLFFLVWSSHAFLYPRQFSHAALFSSPSSVSFLPPPPSFISLSLLLSPRLLHLWVLKLIRVNRCCGCYLCFHLVWLSYKLSTGPAQCRRSA